jgi:hypothetical protein
MGYSGKGRGGPRAASPGAEEHKGKGKGKGKPPRPEELVAQPEAGAQQREVKNKGKKEKKGRKNRQLSRSPRGDVRAKDGASQFAAPGKYESVAELETLGHRAIHISHFVLFEIMSRCYEVSCTIGLRTNRTKLQPFVVQLGAFTTALAFQSFWQQAYDVAHVQGFTSQIQYNQVLKSLTNELFGYMKISNVGGFLMSAIGQVPGLNGLFVTLGLRLPSIHDLPDGQDPPDWDDDNEMEDAFDMNVVFANEFPQAERSAMTFAKMCVSLGSVEHLFGAVLPGSN